MEAALPPLSPVPHAPASARVPSGLAKDPTPILVVEDEAATRALLVHILGRRFAQVLVAGDGADGLAVFRQRHPAIVVTDIQMPIMNGIDMARAIKAEAPATHVIVITAHSDAQAILAAIDVGVVDYVLKPVSAARLAAAVDKCFQITALERALKLSKSRTTTILETLGDAFFALDPDWRFTFLNRKAEEHFQLNRGQCLGTCFRDLPADPLAANPEYEEAMRTQEERRFELYHPGRGTWHDVSVYPLEGGISVYFRDITEKMRSREEIQFLAFHDKLTGLPNRTLLHERLERSILLCKRSGLRGAVLFLDLDRFKTINDSLGHEAGDQVLKEMAGRLRAALRDCDTVARLGGDEFVVVLEGFEHPDNIHSITHRLLLALSQEIEIQGLSLCLTGSIGISYIPSDGDTVEALLKAADTAMYHGKAHGRNNYHFYQAEMNLEKKQFLQLENALRKSVKDMDFILHYQPQFDLRSGELLGFEALVRWQHPELGLIQPDTFIPLAEETGLILLLGNWVLETACSQLQAWAERCPAPLRIAVNLSGRQFWQGDLVETIARCLARAGLAPERLELEITESMVMRDLDQAISKMHELAAMGIRLSMDDFGTGFSSLSALKRFPIHTLKIDKSFVREVTSSPNDAAICASIIALAHTMNLTVVAEGVETPGQMDFLLAKGCEIGQGYLFSRPLPALGAEALLAGRKLGTEKVKESSVQLDWNGPARRSRQRTKSLKERML
jgi:diguanylate cyclase (GGDEF)-like protein/PAS domain S-box-containing protein